MTMTHTYTETDVPAETAVVRPGDTLVLCTRNMVTSSGAERIKASLSEKLPGVNVVIIDDISQALVYRSTE